MALVLGGLGASGLFFVFEALRTGVASLASRVSLHVLVSRAAQPTAFWYSVGVFFASTVVCLALCLWALKESVRVARLMRESRRVAEAVPTPPEAT